MEKKTIRYLSQVIEVTYLGRYTPVVGGVPDRAVVVSNQEALWSEQVILGKGRRFTIECEGMAAEGHPNVSSSTIANPALPTIAPLRPGTSTNPPGCRLKATGYGHLVLLKAPGFFLDLGSKYTWRDEPTAL